MSGWTPPFPLCSASQKESFAYESTVSRWPTILTGIVDELARLNHGLAGSAQPADGDKVREATALIHEIGGLIYEMRHDRELTPLQPTGLPEDTKEYNDRLEQLKAEGKNTWFTCDWLTAECYLYRRLRGLFAVTQHWAQFDPFASQKLSTWRSSAAGAAALARTLEKLVAAGPVDPVQNADKLRLDLIAMLEVDLWGNATDLSLLTSLTHEEIQQLQSVERGQAFVLRNDLDKVWEHVKGLRDARVDFVLDNSGFELYTDLVLADWLVTLSPFVSHVVFHPKLIPWFVSDVQPHDFRLLLDTLADPSFFPDAAGASGLTAEDRTALQNVAARWKRYVADGTFRLAVPDSLQMGQPGGELADFWTSCLPFSELPARAPALLAELQKAELVIFKGDLNYRKLVGDAWWPATTPFDEALGPLRGHLDLLSLRTNKADCCVGLPEGTEERVSQEDPKWRINGKYAVVSFSPRDK